MAYWDTSCLLKLYIPEFDSADFKAHVLRGATILTSEIKRLELWATFVRKETLHGVQAGGARRRPGLFGPPMFQPCRGDTNGAATAQKWRGRRLSRPYRALIPRPPKPRPLAWAEKYRPHGAENQPAGCVTHPRRTGRLRQPKLLPGGYLCR